MISLPHHPLVQIPLEVSFPSITLLYCDNTHIILEGTTLDPLKINNIGEWPLSPVLLYYYIALAKIKEKNKTVWKLKQEIKLFLSVVNKIIYIKNHERFLQSLTKLQKNSGHTKYNILCSRTFSPQEIMILMARYQNYLCFLLVIGYTIHWVFI